MLHQLQPEINFNQYVERMAHVDDKKLIKFYINDNDTILDFGCGSGPLANLFTPQQYTGYDLAPEMVQQAQQEHPQYYFTTNLNNTKFDKIILSSVLHEIYAYNDKSYDHVIKILQEAKELLKPDGQIIIRDGIVPEDNNFYSFKLKNFEDATSFFEELKNSSQFTFNLFFNDGTISGPLYDISNFLNVYTWGWSSLPREKNERVNFANKDQWISLFDKAGLEIVEKNFIVQEDYFKHLSKLVDLDGLSWVSKAFFVVKMK